MEKKIKVLIVDDSALIRITIRKMLEKYPDIEIIGYAKNGKEALEFIEKTRPDVITLDIEMPVMDGLETLKRIMSLPNPIPCIMVSGLTAKGADITLKALDLGAVDFITKPTALASELAKLELELVEKIRAAVTVDLKKAKRKIIERPEPERRLLEIPKLTIKEKPLEKVKYKAVLIGISTGGPPALQEILPQFPENFPVPIVVAQHMPPGFTKPMADRLNKLCPLTVVEANDGDILQKGKIFIGKAGYHIKIRKRGSIVYLNITKQPEDTLYHPQVDIMYETAAETLGGDVIAVIMTGMGSDGSKGLEKLKPKGAYVIAQDKETSAVFGMPRVAIEKGLVDKVLPLQEIPKEIVRKIEASI